MKKAEFFEVGFRCERKLFCKKCDKIKLHYIEVVEESPVRDVVHGLRACKDCYSEYLKLKGTSKQIPSPVEYQGFDLNSYVFLVMNPNYLE